MDSGWNIKHMITIVNSHACKPVSTALKSLQASDPPRAARRAAMRQGRTGAVFPEYCPLLCQKSAAQVFCHTSRTVWENLNFPTRNYEADSGEPMRRGLYMVAAVLFHQHGALAPSREECAAERNRSNIRSRRWCF
jgi:hypothetical protein